MARADARRPTYHHGDLSNALLSAATDLARSAGPQAIVLREAARMVGVSGSSAYRHFADHRALVSAVKRRAQEELTATMQAEPVQTTGDPAADALARVRALGRGYVRFARTQPGLFRTAFDADTPRQETSESFALLTAALDTLVSSGAMPSAARTGAETAVWATVHGLAELMLEGGPLSGLTDDDKTAETDRALEFITRALISSR